MNDYVHSGGANLVTICPVLLSFLALDVSLAEVVLRFTSVAVSIARGIQIFIGGQIQHKHVEESYLSRPLCQFSIGNTEVLKRRCQYYWGYTYVH